MKDNLPSSSPLATAAAGAAPAEEAAGRRVSFRLSHWPTQADFRSHSFHLRQHRPGTRTRFSLLRALALALLLVGQLTLQSACGGTITGNVHAEGKAGADSGGATDDAYASRKYKFIPRMDYAAMHDFVVYVEGSFGTNLATTNIARVTTMKVAQQGATFSPHVLPVMVGTTVQWPNKDDIYHNVFSVSDVTNFDLGLYKGDAPDKCVLFARPGREDVYCSIHTDMHCIVLVLDNPYFASTDAGGNYSIPNVPPGTYKLKAWHDRLPADEQEIIVPTNGTVKADFTLTIKNLPQIGK